MINVSVSLTKELLELLDELVERGQLQSRSEAIRDAVSLYFEEQLITRQHLVHTNTDSWSGK